MPMNLVKIEYIQEQVIHKIGNPVNEMVVRATLESLGIRESDVHMDYGFSSLGDFSLFIFNNLKKRPVSVLVNQNELKKNGKNSQIALSDYLWVKAGIFGRYYPMGILHLMPVFIQIATIIFFGYSLWTYIGFNILQSTSVVLGVILGIVVSGGYVQVLGRQTSFYWNYEEYYKAKIVSDRILIAGVKGMLFVFSVLLVVNLFLQLYPFGFVLVTIIYGFLIGLLLLAIAPYHAIKKRWIISVIIAIATFLALYLSKTTGMHIYCTHWVGILTASILAKVYLVLFFRKRIKASDKEHFSPGRLMVIYKNYRYFFYGFLVYIFIFLDRLLAWSADIRLNHGYLFLYEKNYEIGMDLAILIFFMLAGVMEYAIASFSKFMDLNQKNTSFTQISSFGSSNYRMYQRRIALLMVTGLVTALFLYYFITSPWGYVVSFGELPGSISIWVCIWGGIGYFFLAWGMLNALYMFTLNRPSGPLKALAIAFVLNFVIGLILSRWISYEYSVIGMTLGSIVFMAMTTQQLKLFFKQLDFHYYATY